MKKILFFYFMLTGVLLLSVKAQSIVVSYDFEDETQDVDWHFANDTANGWYIGSAEDVNHTEGGTRAIYVSNDNGITNAYSATLSDSWAYVDVNIPTGHAEFLLEFDWKCYGEGSPWGEDYDYMKVLIGPPATPAGDIPPDGTEALINELRTSNQTCFNGFDGMDYNLYPGWNHFSVAFPSTMYGGQTIRLYLYWHNDSWGSNPPAMTVDNITLTGFDCGSVYDLTAVSSASELTVTFSPAMSTDDAWQYICVPKGTPITDEVPTDIQGTTFIIPGLASTTEYDVYVRTDCGNEYSGWKKQTFRTGCPDNLTLPYVENFDTYASEDYPTCWQRLCNNVWVTSCPSLSSSQFSSGTASLHFYVEENRYNIAIAPAIDVTTNPINTLAVSFKQYKTYAPYGHCEIGIMTDPADANTFTKLAEVSSSDLQEINTWREFDFPLSNYSGEGNYIALRATAGSNPNNNDFYIDDITIYEVPSCYKPIDVKLSDITANSVVIDWTPRNSESTWIIAVVPTGTDPEMADQEYADVHPYMISGLTENTTYDVYVKADCEDGNLSTWSSVVTFTTLCMPLTIEQLPYSENFDGCETGEDAALPDCWLRFFNTLNPYPYPNIYDYDSDSKSMYFHTEGNKYAYLTSQALDLSQFAAGSLHLTCRTLKISSSWSDNTTHGRMDIGYMTVPDDLSTFVLLKAIYPSDYANFDTWYSWDIPIHENLATPVYLAFIAPAGTDNFMYLDDVILDNIPECSAPSDLQISEIRGTSAMVSWTASPYGAADYTVEYSEMTADNWIPIINITDNRVLLPGLTQMTAYNVRVFANCENGNSSDTIRGTFTTGPLAGGDAVIGNSTDENNNLPLNTWYNFNYTQQIFEKSELNGPTRIKGVKFDYSTPDYQMHTKNSVTIYLAHTPKSTFESETDWIPISSATQVYSGHLNCSHGWNTFMFDTPFDYDGTNNIVLIVDDNSGDNEGGNRDKFHTHPAAKKSLACKDDDINPDPSTPQTYATICDYRNNVVFLADVDPAVTCIAPNVLITAVDDHSVTLQWAPGNQENSWEIEYKPVDSDIWIPTESIYESPYTLTPLESGRSYDIRIRSYCDESDYSNWVTLSFTTECAPVTELPLTEDFDAVTGTADNYFADCWTRGTNADIDYPHTDTYYAHSGSHSLYFYGSSTEYSYVATPHLDESIRIDSLTVSFHVLTTIANSSIDIGIMTDPYNYNTFTSVGTVTPTLVNTEEAAEITTSNYAGNGRYVAFRIPKLKEQNMYVDDIIIQYTLGCPRVTDLIVSDITPNSATVSWLPGGNEDIWQYLYGEAGTINLDNDNPTTIENLPSIDLTELTDNTSYDVYVRAICQNGEFGAWTLVRFKTACFAINIPYAHDFETDETGQYAVFPDCWERIYAGPASTPFPYINDLYAHSGNKALYYLANNDNYHDGYALLPYVDAELNPANTLQLSFYARTFDDGAYGIDYTGQVIVGVMEGTNFTSVCTVDVATENFEQYTAILAPYSGTGNRVALRFPAMVNNNARNHISLDDILLEEIPPCPSPTDLTVEGFDNHSITLSWTENGSATEWQIKYGYAGFNPDMSGTEETVTDNPCTINNLAAGALYDFYIRSLCSDNENSGWSPKVTCSTQCDPITSFPYTEDFENGGNMPACWSQEQIKGDKGWTFSAGNHISGMIQNAHSGNYNAVIWNCSEIPPTSIAKLISPVFDLTQVSEPYVSFWHTQELWAPDQDTLKVYYRADNTSDWTLLVDYTNNIFIWKHDSLPLPNPSATYQLAFEGIATYGLGVTLDDITIGDAMYVPVCNTPTNLTTANITENSATLEWNSDEDVLEWTLSYKRADADTWTTDIITDNPHTITGLEAGTTYEAKICANCSNGLYSDYTNIVTFTTQTTGIDKYVPAGELTLYPNPASTYMEVGFGKNLRVSELHVYDVYGKLLQTVKVNDSPTRINVSGLANGVYFVRAITENGIANKSFVKR